MFYTVKNVCVIGAGPSGLCAVKRLIESNLKVTAFETQTKIGGKWIFTEETGIDQNGIEIHSCMYQNLIINGPKEITNFPGLEFPHDERSYVHRDKFADYLNLYADKFDLRKYIKFQHQVIRIRPLQYETWEVIVRNIPENTFEFKHFDAVFICNGYSAPHYPAIPGRDVFKGRHIHSHDYRRPQIFEGEKVLLIGAGPSGLEIALEVGEFVEKLHWSHHTIKTYGRKINVRMSNRVIEKPDVERFTENEVVFIDGSREKITTIIYATGYDFTFPFLSVDCGVSVQDKHIEPLYHHIININRPTMAFIQLTFFGLTLPLADLQVRFVLKFWKREKMLPSKDQMLADERADIEQRISKNIDRRKFHFLGPAHKEYYKNLARLADVEPIRPVMGLIFDDSIMKLFDNFNTFRNFNYEIIDNENFIVKRGIENDQI